jgi:3-oxoacyl-[acyl-carrier protein] reductase
MMPDMLLTGQVVLVTGGSSGIGRAMALAIARAGADVVVTYHQNAAGAGSVTKEVGALGRRSLALQMSLEDQASVRTAAAEAVNAFGRLDAWINNAGADVLTGEAASLSAEERLDLLLKVDLRGTMLASWEAVTILSQQPGGGVIVNMSWDHVVSGMAGINPQLFAAVKGGVLGFSKSLARSVAPRVRVNVLAPGWIQTAFGETLDSAGRDAVAATVPLQRWGTPQDVAAAAVYLISPGASYLTGQTIFIGGGAVMS